MKSLIQFLRCNKKLQSLFFVILYSFVAIYLVDILEIKGDKPSIPLNAYEALGINPLNNYAKLGLIILLGVLGGGILFIFLGKDSLPNGENHSSMNRSRRWIIHFSMVVLTILLAVWKPTDMGFGTLDIFHEGDFLAPAINHENGKIAYKDYYFSQGFFHNVYVSHLSYEIWGKSISSRRVIESCLKITCYLLVLLIIMHISDFDPYLYAPVILVFDILTFSYQFTINRDFFFFLTVLSGILISKNQKKSIRILLFGIMTAFSILTFYYSIDRGFFSIATLFTCLFIFSLIDKTIIYTVTFILSTFIFTYAIESWLGFSIFDIFNYMRDYLMKYYAKVYGLPFESFGREAHLFTLVFVWNIAWFIEKLTINYQWKKWIDFEFFKKFKIDIILLAASLATSMTALSRADSSHLQYALALPVILMLWHGCNWLKSSTLIYNRYVPYLSIVLFAIIFFSRGYIVVAKGYFKESFPTKPDNEYLNINYLNAAEFLKSEYKLGKKMYPINSEVIWFYLTNEPCDCKFQMAIFYQPIQDQLIECLRKNKTEYVITASDFGYIHFDNVAVKLRLSKVYEFVFENYEPYNSFGGVIIYKRKQF